MNGLVQQLTISLRLHFRNRMGLLYGYLFPTIFLVAFWVLYRYEQVPLARHMGELLTVTALGGACFGLPTTLVSERERGVWRRYRLTPASTGMLVASTVAARYLILLSAGLLQLALAMAIGMPLPRHPLALWVAFTLVCFAFLGLGLVIAALADNVPAVQALGQSIFLPMLIIGGVAVRLESLPEWAQHASAFFPGRYAVEAIQACVTGAGLQSVGFSLLALALIGAAGMVAGARLFRWDAGQRFAARGSAGWLAGALGAWLAVGLLAEAGDRALVTRRRATGPVALEPVQGRAAPGTPLPGAAPARPDSTPGPLAAGDSAAAVPPDTAAGSAVPLPAGPAAAPAPEASPPPLPGGGPWQAVRATDIRPELFQNLPPDEGIVAPMAPAGDRPPQASVAREIECIRRALPRWPPADAADPVQRVRNLLFVAAVPDMFKMEELEPWVPRVVFQRLRQEIPRDQLIQLLYWVATHPTEGQHAAAAQLDAVCIDTGGRPMDVPLLRERTAMYALKLLGRLTGQISGG